MPSSDSSAGRRISFRPSKVASWTDSAEIASLNFTRMSVPSAGLSLTAFAHATRGGSRSPATTPEVATVFSMAFSNFFGLNDLFVSDLKNNLKQSSLVSSTYSSTAGTLEFYDAGGELGGSPLVVGSGNTLQGIADLINASITNVVASVVPEGAGQRIRIQHANGSELEVTQTAGTILTDIGLKNSNIGLSQSIEVRPDIYTTPSLVVRGSAQWDATLGAAGEYFISEGDGNIMASLVEKLHLSIDFDAAGDLGDSSLPLMQYASAIISRNTSQANSNPSISGNYFICFIPLCRYM